MLLALVAVGAASAWGLAASGAFEPARPKPVITSRVVFTAVASTALAGRPPCYPRPGLKGVAGGGDVGASWEWEMFPHATSVEIAAQRDCLGRVPELGRVTSRVFTGPPTGRL